MNGEMSCEMRKKVVVFVVVFTAFSLLLFTLNFSTMLTSTSTTTRRASSSSLPSPNHQWGGRRKWVRSAYRYIVHSGPSTKKTYKEVYRTSTYLVKNNEFIIIRHFHYFFIMKILKEMTVNKHKIIIALCIMRKLLIPYYLFYNTGTWNFQDK